MAAIPHTPVRLQLPLLVYSATLLVLITMLVADVDFKAQQIASTDANAFVTATLGQLREASMVPANLNVSTSERALSS